MVFAAQGDLLRDAAQDLAAQIERLDPRAFRVLTLDLRYATAIDPLVVHALVRARELRTAGVGSTEPEGEVRIVVSSGPVQQFLDSLRLDHCFEVIHRERES